MLHYLVIQPFKAAIHVLIKSVVSRLVCSQDFISEHSNLMFIFFELEANEDLLVVNVLTSSPGDE